MQGKKMKHIAIISCTYNGDSPEFLDQMLLSVTTAILPDNITFRIYMHIDGEISSEHETVLNKYNIYKKVRSSSSVGLAHGLNKLISLLEDEIYIFRMDSDDISTNDRFIKQIHFMDKNPDIDISGGSIKEFIGKESNIVSFRSYPTTDLGNHLLKGSPLAHVTVCFRYNFFEKFGIYPVEYTLNEDIAYWFKSFKQGAIGANIQDTLVLVRMDGAYKRRSFKKATSELKVYLQISRWKKKLPFYPLARFLFRLLPTLVTSRIYNSELRNSFLNNK